MPSKEPDAGHGVVSDADNSAALPLPAVFLPGWGLGGASLEFLLNGSPWQVCALPEGDVLPEDFESACNVLAAGLPPVCHLGGWSLGALLALGIARRAPERVCSLTLVAATASFLQRPGWSWGCPPAELRAFQRQVRKSGAAALPGFVEKFCRGDVQADDCARFLLDHAHPPSQTALEAGLNWLAQADLREGLERISCPVTLIHGEADPLMPIAAGAWLADRLPHARLARVSGKAHAPFAPFPADAHFLRECTPS